MLFSSASGQANSTIFTADVNGAITDTLPLSFYAIDCINLPDGRSKNMLIIHLPDTALELLDANLKLNKYVPVEGIDDIVQKDLDMDGKSEILVSNRGTGKISIYREGLTHPVSATISMENAESTISLKLNKLSDPLIYVQSGHNSYLLKYKQNPSYPFYYLIYPGVYLGILGFTLTVKNIQKSQLKKKYENEKKISQLQLALIKNQLDPHFSLNVINSILYSIEYSDRTLAGEQLRQFANLYRNLLLSASSIQTSIKEELDFCNDYLLLEKMRFKEKFEFIISVPDDVNKMTLVPKLLVQQHIENAIKHGLFPLNVGGLLQVNLKNIENGLLIENH